jgi:hypothetical protein
MNVLVVTGLLLAQPLRQNLGHRHPPWTCTHRVVDNRTEVGHMDAPEVARLAALVDRRSTQDLLSRAQEMCALCQQATGVTGVALSIAGGGTQYLSSTAVVILLPGYANADKEAGSLALGGGTGFPTGGPPGRGCDHDGAGRRGRVCAGAAACARVRRGSVDQRGRKRDHVGATSSRG